MDVILLVAVWVGEKSDDRRVSCRPGAEGAPRSSELLVLVEESLDEVVLEVDEGWVAGGARRRDWGMVSYPVDEDLNSEVEMRRVSYHVCGWLMLEVLENENSAAG